MTQELVSVTVDGISIQVPKGTMIIEAAKQAGVRIGLGSDWSPSGSKNLLGGFCQGSRQNRRDKQYVDICGGPVVMMCRA